MYLLTDHFIAARFLCKDIQLVYDIYLKKITHKVSINLYLPIAINIFTYLHSWKEGKVSICIAITIGYIKFCAIYPQALESEE